MKRFILLLSVVSILFLAGCNRNEDINNRVNGIPEVVTDNQQQEIVENNSVSTTDDTKFIVDAYNFSIGDASIKLPKVVFSSEDADKFNKEINEMVKEVKDVNGVACGNYSYKSNIEDGKLYVLIVYNGYVGEMKYYSYIFDISTGKMLSNVEALGQEKANEIMSKLPEIYNKVFSETFGELFKNQEFAKNHTNLESDNNALMPKDIEAVTYYLDSNHGAQIVVEIISIAGPSSTYKLINLNDAPSEKQIKKLLSSNTRWVVTSAYDLVNNKDASITYVYGSSINYNNNMTFLDDGTFKKQIGSYAENYKGTYTIDTSNSSINFTFETGMTTKGSYKYEDKQITSITIIEDFSDDFRYSVTLIPKSSLASDEEN